MPIHLMCYLFNAVLQPSEKQCICCIFSYGRGDGEREYTVGTKSCKVTLTAEGGGEVERVGATFQLVPCLPLWRWGKSVIRGLWL